MPRKLGVVFATLLAVTTTAAHELDDPPGRPAYLASLPRLDLIDAERHRPVADSCTDRPRSRREIHVKAERRFAEEGEVFAFEPRGIKADRREEVTIVFENRDSVRHDLKVPGLNPIFALNVVGPNTATTTFVAPDRDVALLLHCRVATHDRFGMTGTLTAGTGSAPLQVAQSATRQSTGTVQGVGTVIATAPRMSRVIVNHEEIKGFMAAMEMSFSVSHVGLLEGLAAGDRIGFELDRKTLRILKIDVLERANNK